MHCEGIHECWSPDLCARLTNGRVKRDRWKARLVAHRKRTHCDSSFVSAWSEEQDSTAHRAENLRDGGEAKGEFKLTRDSRAKLLSPLRGDARKYCCVAREYMHAGALTNARVQRDCRKARLTARLLTANGRIVFHLQSVQSPEQSSVTVNHHHNQRVA